MAPSLLELVSSYFPDEVEKNGAGKGGSGPGEKEAGRGLLSLLDF